MTLSERAAQKTFKVIHSQHPVALCKRLFSGISFIQLVFVKKYEREI